MIRRKDRKKKVVEGELEGRGERGEGEEKMERGRKRRGRRWRRIGTFFLFN
jgi:hypothetical protein